MEVTILAARQRWVHLQGNQRRAPRKARRHGARAALPGGRTHRRALRLNQGTTHAREHE